MRRIGGSSNGLFGLVPFPRGHAGDRVVTVATISTPGTLNGRATAMASQVRVVCGSTTTGTGVSFIYILSCGERQGAKTTENGEGRQVRGRKQQKTVGGEKCTGGGKTEGGEGGTGEKGKFDSAIFSKQRSPSLFVDF